MKKQCIFGILGLAILGIVVSYSYMHVFHPQLRKPKDGFCIKMIASNLSYDASWNVSHSHQELEKAREVVSKPLTYMGKGAQSYVFLSHDGEYVIKFFRHLIFKPIKGNCKNKEIKKVRLFRKKRRQEMLFSGYKIGYEQLPQETGVCFLHLNKTEGLFPECVAVYDSLNQKQILHLDDHEFIIQKKGMYVNCVLEDLMSKGKLEEAKERIDQLFMLSSQFAWLGCFDKDESWFVSNNVGFSKESAMLIDLGFITQKNEPCSIEEFDDFLQRFVKFEGWLSVHYPDLTAHCRQKRLQCRDEYIHKLEMKRLQSFFPDNLLDDIILQKQNAA